MTYLVDANVLSEPTKPEPSLTVVRWLRDHEREFVIDPIILGELRFGILCLPNGKRRARLERWFESGVQQLQCVPWDAVTGIRWAELVAKLHSAGRAMPVKDSFIAATALANDLTLVTRNRADFEKTGVRLFDPFHS